MYKGKVYSLAATLVKKCFPSQASSLLHSTQWHDTFSVALQGSTRQPTVLIQIESSKVCDTSTKGVVEMTHVLLLLPSKASPD